MYCTNQQVSDYLKRNLTAHEVSILPVLIRSAQDFINDYCDTDFEDTNTNTVKYYDGEGLQEIDIDAAKDITLVQITDDEIVTSTYQEDDYVLEPVNQTIKTSIRLKQDRFPYGAANIKVTGKFTSYEGKIPERISLAATMLVADYINGTRDIASESIEGWSVTYGKTENISSEVKDMLQDYRRTLL